VPSTAYALEWPLRHDGRTVFGEGSLTAVRKAAQMKRRSRVDPAPVLITSAAPSRFQEHADRRKHYAIVMSVRVVCFILAIVVQLTWLRVTFIIGALVLPWVAVIAANQVKATAVRSPSLFVPTPRNALTGRGPEPERADRRP
jgi:hypothetical protein